MTAIISDWVDSTAGSATIVAMASTIDNASGTSHTVYSITNRDRIRFIKYVY